MPDGTRIMRRDWMQVLIQRGVLVQIEKNVPPVLGGTTLICDSETDPTRILVLGDEDVPVHLIALENGVLTCSPDTKLSEQIGIDPMPTVVAPLARTWNVGIRSVLLCLNVHSIGGVQHKLTTIELINHLMRAGAWLCQRIEGLRVVYLVHVPHSLGVHTNYLVELPRWRAFYNEYDVEILGRQDDSDPGYQSNRLLGHM